MPPTGRVLVATDGVVESVRVRKDDYEVAVFRDAAGRLSDVACGVLADVVRAGRTESDIAAEIDRRMKRSRVLPAGLRDHRRVGATQRPSARTPHRARGRRG